MVQKVFPHQMKVSIQSVLYEPDAKTLERQLLSIIDSIEYGNFTNDYFEISLYINSSNTTIRKLVLSVIKSISSFIKIDCVFSDGNIGHGQAHNALFFREESSSDYLWLINPDGLVGVACLRELVDTLVHDPNVVAAEARQLPFDHPKKFKRGSFEPSWVSGACLLVRSGNFRAIGGFDPIFFLHGDDVDLSYRLRSSGGKLIYVPQALFFHDKNLSAQGFPVVSKAEEYYGPLSSLILAHRYGQKIKLRRMIRELELVNSTRNMAVLGEYFTYIKNSDLVYFKKMNRWERRPWRFGKHRY